MEGYKCFNCPRAGLSHLTTPPVGEMLLQRNFILNLPSLLAPMSTPSSGLPFTDWKPAPRKNEVFLRQIQIYLRLSLAGQCPLTVGNVGLCRGYPLVAAARNCVTSKEVWSTATPPGVSLGDAPRAKEHHQVSGPRASALGAAGDLTVSALVGQGDCTRES